jgi:hypothetical protein
MQPLLTKDILEKIGRYAGEGGSCPDEARDLLRRIHEFLSFAGTQGVLKKWCVCTIDSYFTLPPDMQVPLKYIDNGRLEKVWDKWFEFSGQANSYDMSVGVEGMFEDPNPYYTVYDGPDKPYHILVVPYEEEDADAHVIVSGHYYGSNAEVRSEYNGKRYRGEYIQIVRDNPHYSHTQFSKIITGITKSVTKYPIRLEWYIPETGEQGFLCDLPPRAQATVFKRVRLANPCSSRCHKLTILGRMRLKDYYEDNDILPFDSEDLYISTAQMINLKDRNSLDVAITKEKMIRNTINEQNDYNRTTTSQPSIIGIKTTIKPRQTIRVSRRY